MLPQQLSWRCGKSDFRRNRSAASRRPTALPIEPPTAPAIAATRNKSRRPSYAAPAIGPSYGAQLRRPSYRVSKNGHPELVVSFRAVLWAARGLRGTKNR